MPNRVELLCFTDLTASTKLAEDAGKPRESPREGRGQDQDENDVCHRTDRR